MLLFVCFVFPPLSQFFPRFLSPFGLLFGSVFLLLHASALLTSTVWLKSVTLEEQNFAQPVSVPIHQENYHLPHREPNEVEQVTSVQSHVLGLKFAARLCSLTALSPPPVRVQIPPGGGGGGSKGCLGPRGRGQCGAWPPGPIPSPPARSWQRLMGMVSRRGDQ